MRGSYQQRIITSSNMGRRSSKRYTPNAANNIQANAMGMGMGVGGMGMSSGNYITNQHPESGIDMMNIYSTHRYLPKNPLLQNAIYRQIYRYDSTAGAVIELYSNMPWSDFQLGNIADVKIRNLYEDAFSNLDLVTKLPHLTRDYLILGKMCGFLPFDESKGVWSHLIQQNPDYIRIFPIPFSNQDPLIFLTPPRELATLAQKITNLNIKIDDPDSKRLLECAATMQPTQLDNASTFYMPRKSFVDDYNGTSIYTRILSLVLLEAALLNANLLNAFRRAGPIRLLTPDASQSEYMSPEQLDSIALMFMEADTDPAGSTIVLDKPISVDTVGPANDSQWRVFDEWGTLQAAKMNALGFSESLISGDSSYQAGDNQISIFLERLRALRNDVTNSVIINHICLNMAKANDFVKRTQAERDHGIRVNSKGDGKYILPSIQWNKPLTPVGNQDFLNLLTKAKEEGVPISVRTWASACGVDFQTEVENLMQDSIDRSLVSRYKTSNDLETADDRPYGAPDPSEFKDIVTSFNFKLLTKDQIKNFMLLYRSNTETMRKSMIPAQFVVFQLYLASVGVPYEHLSSSEFELLDKLLQDQAFSLDSNLSDKLGQVVEEMKTKVKPESELTTTDVTMVNTANDTAESQHSYNTTNNPAPDTTLTTISKDTLEKSLDLAIQDFARTFKIDNIKDANLVNLGKSRVSETSDAMSKRLIHLRDKLKTMTPEEVSEYQLEPDQQDDKNQRDKLKETLEFIKTLKLGDDYKENSRMILTHLKLLNALEKQENA